MADNVVVTAGSGTTIAADEVVDGTLGTVKVQYVKLMGGALNDTTKAAVGANGLQVDGSAVTQPISAASLPLPTGAMPSSGGSVTANAGTNLNTSALALETGGNLAATAAVAGVTSSAAVITDANGTLQQYLRGLVKLFAAAVSGIAGAFNVKLTDGTTIVPILAASSGAPAATVPAIPVSLRDMLAPGSAVSSSSAPVVAASDQATLAFAFDTSQLMNGKSGVGLTPTKTKVNVSSSGASTVVALVSGKKIRVLSGYIVAAGAVTLNWQSHTTTATADGPQALTANGGLVLPFNPLGWFDTAVGEALDLNLGGAVQVGGSVQTIAV